MRVDGGEVWLLGEDDWPRVRLEEPRCLNALHTLKRVDPGLECVSVLVVDLAVHGLRRTAARVLGDLHFVLGVCVDVSLPSVLRVLRCFACARLLTQGKLAGWLLFLLPGMAYEASPGTTFTVKDMALMPARGWFPSPCAAGGRAGGGR